MMERLILGTAQMGMNYGINNRLGKIPKNEAYRIFHACHAAGIRRMDTAEVYGSAHQLIGEYHRDHETNRFRIITKIPDHLSTELLQNRVQQYLQELGVETLDTLLFHSFESYLKHSKLGRNFNELIQTGCIQQIGVSIYTNSEFAEVLKDDRIDVIQFPFNLLDNYSKRGELIEMAVDKGKTLHTRSVFLQGLFFKELNSNDQIVKKLEQELTQIRDIAEEVQMSIVQLAMNYCLSYHQIDGILLGVDSHAQLSENLAVLDYGLDENLRKRIEQIDVSNIDLLNPSLWNQ